MAPSAKPKFPQEVRRTTPSGKVASVCDTAFGPPLRAFREKYDLSTRELACVMSLVQKGPGWATVKSMLHERAGVGVVKQYTPAMLAGITQYLRGQGLNHTALLAELKKLFPKENLEQMTAPRTVLDYEHLEYFGLNDDPFTDDPASAKDVFTTPQLDKILERLEDAVNFKKFVAVTGDIGAGKTIMKRRLVVAAERPPKKMRLIWPKFAKMGRITSADIVIGALEALKQKPRARLTLSQVQLETYLTELDRQDFRVALCFDEAHRLHPDTFSELKNFFELSNGGFGRLLGIVFFGQPQLRDRLEDLRFREITERVRVIPMPSMSKQATQYIAHRLRLVGGDVNKLFEPGAIKIIADQVSTPQAIGNLAAAALIRSYEVGNKKVEASLVKTEFGGPQVRHIKRTT